MNLKEKLKKQEITFLGWVSYYHPSIVETLLHTNIDGMFIDMEHTPISLNDAQNIIQLSQSYGVECIPRPISNDINNYKKLLELGANGLLFPMIETSNEIISYQDVFYYPPKGKRSYGVNRAHSYGLKFDEYTKEWNSKSIFMIQIESVQGVDNLETILTSFDVDGVMIGPYDMSASIGKPGDIHSKEVKEMSKRVIDICNDYNVSVGTQIKIVDDISIKNSIQDGFNFIILSSDLFLITEWVQKTNGIIDGYK